MYETQKPSFACLAMNSNEWQAVSPLGGAARSHTPLFAVRDIGTVRYFTQGCLAVPANKAIQLSIE